MKHAAFSFSCARRVPRHRADTDLLDRAPRKASAFTKPARLPAMLFALLLTGCGMVVEVADTAQPASCDIAVHALSVPAGIELDAAGSIITGTPELVGTGAVVANTSRVRGAWYFEVQLQAGSNVAVGLSAAVDSSSRPGGLGPGCGLQRTGVYCSGETALATALNLGPGDVLGVAFDLSAGEGYFHVNGIWVGGRDPALLDEGFVLSDILTLAYFPKIALEQHTEVRVNFAGPFIYAPPPDFLPYGVCIIGE